jgi:peptide deformylase
MTVKPLIILPDPLLRQTSLPVTRFDAALRTLVADMFDTMYDAPGIGLAAIQIGVPTRVVTMDFSRKEDAEKKPEIYINPEILWASDETIPWEEGCLSIPEYYEDVERAARVRVRHQDLEGTPMELEAEGIHAVCFQHEIDHLNGVLFIDHISRLKRDRVTKKFAKALKMGIPPSQVMGRKKAVEVDE